MKRFNTRCFMRIFLVIAMICIMGGCTGKKTAPIQLTQNTGSDENAAVYAVINIRDFGTMKFRLLDKYAPDTVAFFTELVQNGYFNNKPIYMVINDFCMIAGSASDDEYNGKPLICENDNTTDQKCYPLRGSLCYTEAVGQNRYKASNFTVIQTGTSFLDELEQFVNYKKVTLAEYFKQAYGNEISEEELKIFRKYGGAPWLNDHCIVFGQLAEGEEVLDRICAVEVSDDSGFEPVEEIIIESISIER